MNFVCLWCSGRYVWVGDYDSFRYYKEFQGDFFESQGKRGEVFDNWCYSWSSWFDIGNGSY